MEFDVVHRAGQRVDLATILLTTATFCLAIDDIEYKAGVHQIVLAGIEVDRFMG